MKKNIFSIIMLTLCTISSLQGMNELKQESAETATALLAEPLQTETKGLQSNETEQMKSALQSLQYSYEGLEKSHADVVATVQPLKSVKNVFLTLSNSWLPLNKQEQTKKALVGSAVGNMLIGIVRGAVAFNSMVWLNSHKSSVVKFGCSVVNYLKSTFAPKNAGKTYAMYAATGLGCVLAQRATKKMWNKLFSSTSSSEKKEKLELTSK